jgi:hypothetical protein
LAEAERAMQWPHGAGAARYRKVAVMQKDPDFHLLRSRGDFQGLMMDLEFPNASFARGD